MTVNLCGWFCLGLGRLKGSFPLQLRAVYPCNCFWCGKSSEHLSGFTTGYRLFPPLQLFFLFLLFSILQKTWSVVGGRFFSILLLLFFPFLSFLIHPTPWLCTSAFCYKKKKKTNIIVFLNWLWISVCDFVDNSSSTGKYKRSKNEQQPSYWEITIDTFYWTHWIHFILYIYMKIQHVIGNLYLFNM